MRRALLFVAAIILADPAAAARSTITDLQPNTFTATLTPKSGAAIGSVRLTNLNTRFNIWYLLAVRWPGEQRFHTFHLENPAPERFSYHVDPAFAEGLLIKDGDKQYPCSLWNNNLSELRSAARSNKSFVSICQQRVMVRNTTAGKETTTEFVADFLRNNVWGGEQITGLVKDYIYKDKFLITSNTQRAAHTAPASANSSSTARPRSAAIDANNKNITIDAEDLGIELARADPARMHVGQWYDTKASPHIFVSAIQPRFIERSILTTQTQRVKRLDAIEKTATVYLAAFKLSKFDLGFALGTLHPAAGWSYRAPKKLKSSGKPGPDGIANYQPLVMVGKVNPVNAPKVAAVFAGGFKRTHGAFKWGRLSQVNQASHYGFRVNGVTFSTLQPDLATLLIYRDGKVGMKTWQDADNKSLPTIIHARQNGVPIIEWDATSQQGIPGEFVSDWGKGNWSGSAQREQRTLRAATCLQQVNGESYLIFGYFSSVTPNSIARVFQAYHCRYAFHLDMNGLEHTYLAVYVKQEKTFRTQYLVEGMKVLDRKEKGTGTLVPRFLGTADNRDFFYVMEKD